MYIIYIMYHDLIKYLVINNILCVDGVFISVSYSILIIIIFIEHI